MLCYLHPDFVSENYSCKTIAKPPRVVRISCKSHRGIFNYDRFIVFVMTDQNIALTDQNISFYFSNHFLEHDIMSHNIHNI